MRKVHYKVVLDVFTHEHNDVDGVEALESSDIWPDIEDGDVELIDVTIEEVTVTDSH